MSVPRLPQDAPSGGGSSPASSPSSGGTSSSSGGSGGGTILANGGGSAFVSNVGPVITGPGSGQTSKQFTGMFQVVRLTADRCEFGPAVDVPVGSVVSVAPIPTNTTNAFVSVGAGFEAAKSGPRFSLAAAGNPRTIKCRNLREIGVYSTVVGEGVTIDIQEGS